MSEYEDNTLKLVDSLPSYYPKDGTNYKLLKVIGDMFDEHEKDIEKADKATHVQTAESIGQLEQHGKMMDIKPYNNEDKERYRARVIAEYQILTSEGSIYDLLQSISTIFKLDVTKIRYEELSERNILVSLPRTAVDESPLQTSDISEIFDKLIAAGGSVEGTTRGTLEYITPTEYTEATYDTQYGYDGLDTNGDPKGTGGTYSEYIQ